MKHYNLIVTALIFSGLFLVSCQQKDTVENKEYSGVKIANPIIYEVLVTNPNPEDDWKTECLANTNIHDLVKDIINAVRNGDLPAFDYYDNHQLSIPELEKIIAESDLMNKTGNIQFEEEWFWNAKKLSLEKRVKKMMFGYEIYDALGKVRGYKASFVVDLYPDTK
ncbi:hypothetical protein [Labilibaculum euxinus]|uniref:Lipoprotein n=1 Tax=Labilibaculum euxinus TaxID=2686357 RepID=A0A7M4D9X1_9BACT|nr:hypothetical protein [Labilibaculum euxinus]MUP39450.1 hypothetical protein [Labilibaculum euxinus]MVB08655.1 hypothetical protein [Labilibaculum euxinus]